MSAIDKLLSQKPGNIGEKSLNIAKSRKNKVDESRFANYYTDDIMSALYYIWKTEDFSMTDMLVYIKAEYGRKTSATYMKSKLLAFEKRLKNGDIKKAESTKEGQYCISSERPIKHHTFVKTTPEPTSTEKPQISAFDENEKTVLQDEVPVPPEKSKSEKKAPAKKVTKKVETPDVDEKKAVAKKPIKKVVNNSLPQKKPIQAASKKNTKDNDNQDKKLMSIREKYPEKFKKEAVKKESLPVEEIEPLDVEVIGQGYDSQFEQELAERKVREKLLHKKLADKKRKGIKLTLPEDRALWNLTKVDFTDPADRDEIVVVVVCNSKKE